MKRTHAAQLDREITEALARRSHAQKRPKPFIPNGRAKGRHPREFDQVQLRTGTKHEMEHTTSRHLAQQIAMDHLAEDPLYYVKLARIHHSRIATAPGRWNHRAMARSFTVDEDVVRRIYAAVQTAKRQGLYGGYMADLIERNVGRKLVGGEYMVATRAKEHLGYDPPGGYGGPKPKASAKEPARARYDDPKIERASRFVTGADKIIKDVLARKKHPTFGWDETKDSIAQAHLRHAADDLEVAADLYEEAGGGVRAGTLRQRAKYARAGNYKMLAAYD